MTHRLSILLALCVTAAAQIAISPKGTPHPLVIQSTNHLPYSFFGSTNSTYFWLPNNGGTVRLVVNGKDTGEFFVVLSNQVWTVSFTNRVLKPVPLISLTNLVNALTTNGDICRVKGHPYGEETIDTSWVYTSIPPQYGATRVCGMCGITNTYTKSIGQPVFVK